MICPRCGARNDDDLRFCDLCGADLSSASLTEIEDSAQIPVIQVVEQATATVSAPHHDSTFQAAPEPKKGRLWPPALFLSLMILCGTLCFFLIPGHAQAPTDDSPQAWFTVINGVLAFHPEYYDGPSELVIPETVHGQTVTGIAKYAFSGVNSISTVILPDTVTQIGDYAFSGCKRIRGIYIPDGVHTIGVYAFADCDAMEAIYFPETMKNLGHSALDSCDSLRYILFDGTYQQWTTLYNGYFVTTVELHATDGVYYTRP